MLTTRIERYIFREVGLPSLISLAIFTFVLMGGRLLKLAKLIIGKGVAASEVFGLLGTLLPVFFLITLPLAFLLGVLLGFSRLSADSEVVALKSAGVSLFRMARPVFALAFLILLGTSWLSLHAEPRARQEFRDRLFQIAQKRASLGLVPQVFNSDFPGVVLFTREMDDQKDLMKGVFISDQRLDQSPATIFAREGRIISDQEKHTITLRLKEGDIHRRPAQGKSETYQIIHFANYDLQLKFDQDEEIQGTKKPGEMSMAELRAASTLAEEPRKQRELRTEFQQRFILALSPLLFALIAIPLGIRSHRSGRGAGFSIGLLVFLLFHMFYSFTETLVIEKGWPLLLTLWTPSLLFLIIGVLLLRAAAYERPWRVGLAKLLPRNRRLKNR